jgi:hypothetical protein
MGLDEVFDGLQAWPKSRTFMNGKVTAIALTKLSASGNVPGHGPWCNLSNFCKAQSIRRGRNLEITGYEPACPL